MATWRLATGSRELFAAPRAAVLRSFLLNHCSPYRPGPAVQAGAQEGRVPKGEDQQGDESGERTRDACRGTHSPRNRAPEVRRSLPADRLPRRSAAHDHLRRRTGGGLRALHGTPHAPSRQADGGTLAAGSHGVRRATRESDSAGMVYREVDRARLYRLKHSVTHGALRGSAGALARAWDTESGTRSRVVGCSRTLR